jgi:hypothetical protein
MKYAHTMIDDAPLTQKDQIVKQGVRLGRGLQQGRDYGAVGYFGP